MLAALAATLVVVLVGCTAVFGPRIVSFADAEPSPPEAVDWVALVRNANAITAPGLPDFDPAQTRRLLDGPFHGGTLAIDLTPAERGFCVSLTHALQMSAGTATDCVDAKRRRAQPVTVIEPDGRARDETDHRPVGCVSRARPPSSAGRRCPQRPTPWCASRTTLSARSIVSSA